MRFIKTFCISITVFLLALSAAVLNVCAEDEYKFVSKRQDETIDVGSISSSGFYKSGSVPSSYDLRKSARVTSVKDQGDYGSCWAFATMAASESSLITEFPYTYANVDLSELHLLYYSGIETSDPLGGTAGDKISLSRTQNFLDVGNNFYASTFTLAKWVGAAKESELDYSLAYPNMTAALSKAFNDTAHLENAEWISMRDTDYIKNTIMKKGAVSVAYYCNDDVYLNSSTNAYYCSRALSGNHAVTIVGWDDNYSVNNFGIIKPSKNGAWLAKSSYGTDYGNDGYIWISYSDLSLLNTVAVFYDYAPADNYDKNYQYDGGQNIGYYELKNGSGYMANTFTAAEDEILKAVSFYTLDTDTLYDVTVFTEVPDSGVPVCGKAHSECNVSGAFSAAGYHTVKLAEEISLAKGSRFSVVIRLRNTSSTTKLLVDYTSYMGNGIYNYTSSEKQQSVISTDGTKWLDLYSDSSFSTLGTNFRIKAFTDNGYVKTDSASFEKAAVSVSPGNTCSLSVRYTPLNATPKFTWSSSDTSVAKVDSSGIVTAVACGVCIISAKSVYGGHTASCILSVQPGKVTGLKSTVTGTNSYKLSWNKTDGASYYRVYRYDSTKKLFVKLADTQNNYYSVTGVEPKTAVQYRVCAINNKNGTVQGEYSSAVYAASVANASGLTAKASTESSITLSWEKSDGITGYIVYILKDGAYKQTASTKSTSYTVSSLSSMTEYTFKVAAYVKLSQGTFTGKQSSEVKAYTKMSAAKSLRKTAATTTSVTLRWNTVSNAAGYYVYKYDTVKKSWSKIGYSETASKKVSGLTSGTVYKFKVRPYAKVSGNTFYGEYSNILSCCTTPSAPSLTSVVKKGNNIKITWDKTGCTGYELYVKSSVLGSYSKVGTFSSSKTSSNLSGLKKGVTYYFRMRSYVTVGSTKYYSAYSTAYIFRYR